MNERWMCARVGVDDDDDNRSRRNRMGDWRPSERRTGLTERSNPVRLFTSRMDKDGTLNQAETNVK